MRLPGCRTIVLVAFAAALPVAAGALGKTTLLAPRLPDLLRRSSIVVLADVGSVTEHDNGRLTQAHLEVSHAIKGTLDTGSIRTIASRDFPSVPPFLRTGARIVVFLVEAQRTSQLRRALPPGQAYFRVVEERWGRLELPDSASERAVLDALDGWIEIARAEQPDLDLHAAAVRRLVFSELGARHPRLVEDGVAGLADLPSLSGTLTDAEHSTLARALQREDLQERIRIALVETIGHARLTSLAPVLRNLPGAGPDLAEAAAVVRVRLGSVREPRELKAAFRDEDPTARAAAVSEAAAAPSEISIEEIGNLAVNDPARKVRLAAIDALGKTGSPTALPPLGRAFTDSDNTIRQKSAQAIHQIGGRQAAELLAGLAFTAPPDAQHQAVALLMALGIPRDDALLSRIRNTHPNAAVRNLVAHGLPGDNH